MKCCFSFLALVAGLGLAADSATIAQDGEVAAAVFHPPGMWAWDNWFVHDGQRWHAFYLQLPKAVGPQRRWKDNDFYKHVGHATSTNLRDWQDQGPALCALSGTWNDRHIATGSVARHEGRWWMAFTGRGTKGDGVGLAVSDDLTTWQPAQDNPLFALADTFGAAAAADGVFSSVWKGETRRWVGISDPYLVPEPLDGWFLMVLCARVLDVPRAQSGCLTLLRSRDLRHWEQPVMLAWPCCFERMETPQLWTRLGRWYLSFGGVLDAGWARAAQATLPSAVRGQSSHQNYCYAMNDLVHPASEDRLQHIAVPRGHYIMKVLPLSPGRDVAIFTQSNRTDSGISPPYAVEYFGDGSLRIVTGMR
jgi:beta-fructofuranosidase